MGDQGYMDAAAVPVPDAGDDTLRLTLARAIGAHTERCSCCPTIKVYEAFGLADALLPRIREHVAAAEKAERERISALLASVPDEYYPEDVFGAPLSAAEARQANELLNAEGLPTFDRVSANAMRHSYRNAARLALEEPDDD